MKAEQRAGVELLRSILDQTPTARARLFDLLESERQKLAVMLASRLGGKESDPGVILTARFTMLLAETAADLSRHSSHESPLAIAKRLLRAVHAGGMLLPAPAPRR